MHIVIIYNKDCCTGNSICYETSQFSLPSLIKYFFDNATLILLEWYILLWKYNTLIILKSNSSVLCSLCQQFLFSHSEVRVSLLAERFYFTYDLNGFKCRVNWHVLSLPSSFLVTLCLEATGQLCVDSIPIKKIFLWHCKTGTQLML